jgi:hypothetical protein
MQHISETGKLHIHNWREYHTSRHQAFANPPESSTNTNNVPPDDEPMDATRYRDDNYDPVMHSDDDTRLLTDAIHVDLLQYLDNVTFAPDTQARNDLLHRSLLTTIGQIHQSSAENPPPATQNFPATMALPSYRNVMAFYSSLKSVSSNNVDDQVDQQATRSTFNSHLHPAMVNVTDNGQIFHCPFSNRDVPLAATQDEIIQAFNLNREQMAAFRLIVRCFDDEDNVDRRRIYLGGKGGTRKSVVIKSVQCYLGSHNRSNELVLMAMTGRAARLVHGKTVHSTIGLRPGASVNRSVPIALSRKIIDEISLAGKRMLAKINIRLNRICNQSWSKFGNKHMVFCNSWTNKSRNYVL